jgi:hypothetical protein
MTATYLQTVKKCSSIPSPTAIFDHRGKIVDLTATKDTAILAIERDDIFRYRPDQGCAGSGRPVWQFKRAIIFAEGRPLRHLQWQPLARQDRSGGRGISGLTALQG